MLFNIAPTLLVLEDGLIESDYGKDSNIISIAAGSQFKIKCKADADDVKWFKNYDPGNRKEMDLVSESPEIVIDSVQHEASGVYYCYGYRKDGKPFIDNVHLIVKGMTLNVSSSGQIN